MMSGTLRHMHGRPGRVATGLAEMLSACFAVLIWEEEHPGPHDIVANSWQQLACNSRPLVTAAAAHRLPSQAQAPAAAPAAPLHGPSCVHRGAAHRGFSTPACQATTIEWLLASRPSPCLCCSLHPVASQEQQARAKCTGCARVLSTSLGRPSLPVARHVRR